MPRRACTVPRADLKRNFEGGTVNPGPTGSIAYSAQKCPPLVKISCKGLGVYHNLFTTFNAHAGMARQGDRIADSVAGILPGSIPRGAAKTGILAVGGLIAFSLLQKVSTL